MIVHKKICGNWWFVREDTSDERIVEEMFEYPLYDFYQFRGLPVQTVVDIGAHIGSFAKKAKMWWPAATVYAFEPMEESFKLLQVNTKDLDIVRVPAAICGSNPPVGLREHSPLMPASTVLEYGTGEPLCLYIPFQDVCPAGRPIDILKLDCEGGELEFLDSIRLQDVGIFFAELHLKLGRKRLIDWTYRQLESLKLTCSFFKVGKHVHIAAANTKHSLFH